MRNLFWLSRAVPVLLIVGVPLNLIYAAAISGLLPASTAVAQRLGMMSLALGEPMLATVYLTGIIRFARRAVPGSGWLAAVRNSLLGYVVQGVIAGLVLAAMASGSAASSGKPNCSSCRLLSRRAAYCWPMPGPECSTAVRLRWC